MKEVKLRDKPYAGMGNVSKSEGLYKKKPKTIEDIMKHQFWLQKRLDKSLISEAGHGHSLITSLLKGDTNDFNIKKLLEKDYRVFCVLAQLKPGQYPRAFSLRVHQRLDKNQS